MAARIGNVTLDCGDVMRTALFWSAVLDRPLDHGSSEVFATIGGSDGNRTEPAWYFNKVTAPKVVKNRLHLDLVDPDPLAIDKLVALGASVVDSHRFRGHAWTIMQDPEGNEFCIAARSFTG